MENLNEIMGGLVITTGFVLIVFIIARYSYFVRKLMIEKGMSSPSGSGKLRLIDAGCIVLGLGVGILISAFFTTLDISEDTMDLLIWGTILIFGALGLLVAHHLRKRLEK